MGSQKITPTSLYFGIFNYTLRLRAGATHPERALDVLLMCAWPSAFVFKCVICVSPARSSPAVEGPLVFHKVYSVQLFPEVLRGN